MVADPRSRGSGLKVASINQESGLELQSISTEDPETSVGRVLERGRTRRGHLIYKMWLSSEHSLPYCD